MARHVIHAARGRGGWLKECVHRLQMPDYWGGGRHHVGALCTDTEIAIREDGCGPACGDLPPYPQPAFDGRLHTLAGIQCKMLFSLIVSAIGTIGVQRAYFANGSIQV